MHHGRSKEDQHEARGRTRRRWRRYSGNGTVGIQLIVNDLPEIAMDPEEALLQRALCRVLRALGKAPIALGKGFVECRTR